MVENKFTCFKNQNKSAGSFDNQLILEQDEVARDAKLARGDNVKYRYYRFDVCGKLFIFILFYIKKRYSRMFEYIIK